MAKLFNLYKILLQHFQKSVKDYFKNWRQNLKHLFTAHIKEKVIAITLAILTFVYVRYQDVEQRNLFVPLKIKKIDELTFVNDLPDTVSLFVSGNRSALDNLDVNKIQAQIDLTDVTSPGVVHRSPILKSLPEGIKLLRINPQTLEIELSNLEKKLLRVEANLVGKTRSGFQIKRVQVSPSRLWVMGPRDIIDDITKIETEPINIDSLDQSKQISVAFNKNIHPGLIFDRTRQLDVQISIEYEYTTQNLVDLVEVEYEFEEKWQLDKPLWVSNISYEIHKDNVSDFMVEQDLVFYFETETINKLGSYEVKIKFKKNRKLRNIIYQPKKAIIEVVEIPDKLD